MITLSPQVSAYLKLEWDCQVGVTLIGICPFCQHSRETGHKPHCLLDRVLRDNGFATEDAREAARIEIIEREAKGDWRRAKR